MTRVSPESIYRAALALWTPDADLLFISCTALRAAQTVDRLECDLDVPVVASNQTMVWHALERIGRPYDITGYGSLFRQRLPVSS